MTNRMRAAAVALALSCGGTAAAQPPAALQQRAVSCAPRPQAESQAPSVPASPRASSADPATGLEIHSITFVGVGQVDREALENAMRTRSSPWWPWGRKQYFDRSVFEEDLKRIVEFYREQGYREAEVVSCDVAVDRRQRVDITIRVREGEPTLISDVVLEGFDVLPADRVAAIRRSLPVSVGSVAVRPLIAAAGELAADALRNAGYAYAEVRIEEVVLEPRRLRIRYVAVPGLQAFFGPIEIAGNKAVDDGIIRREVAYRPGELFEIARIRETQRRLQALGLFSSVAIEALEGPSPIEVPTRITVTEASPMRTSIAGGWATEEHLNGEITWQHLNFLGGARVLTARGVWSSIQYGGEAGFRQPHFFRPGAALVLDGHAWYASERIYHAGSEGGGAAFEWQFAPGARWRAAYRHESARTRLDEQALQDLGVGDTLIQFGLNPVTGEQEGVLSSLSFEVAYTSMSDRPVPLRGYAADMLVEHAGGVLPGDYDYTKVTAEIRGYRPLGDRVVLAGRVRSGAIEPAGDDGDVPFFKRYFLGGSTSLRGWGRFEVAPRSPSGVPLGGLSLFEASAELRVDTWGGLGVVLFADAGNAWRNPWQFRLGDLRYAAGPGLRLVTPLGPIRFDVGYQLTPIEGLRVDGQLRKRRWRMHFSIGQSF